MPGERQHLLTRMKNTIFPQKDSYGSLNDDEDGKKASRVIPIGQPSEVKFSRNKISTAKYNVLTFLPKFLLEQFSRYSNVFFLFIACMQQIPDVSPTGRYTTALPLLAVLTVSAVKEIIEDIKRHRADDETNNRLVYVLRNDEFVQVKWTDVVVGDIVKVINKQFFPADLILLSSSEPMGMCYIETANLDGETNLKIRQALPLTAEKVEKHDMSSLKGRLECEGPNNRLYEFIGNIRIGEERDTPLSADQILLRGAQLRNTQWIYGLAIYTGHESKLLQNATAAPIKRSNVDRMTNIQILYLGLILLVLALISAIFNHFWDSEQNKWYVEKINDSNSNFGFQLLTFIILYNNLIPISLPVTLEVVKFIQAFFINNDLDMYYEESDTPAMARTSNLNEELGQVKFIFSDKTGTLTRNIMELKKMTIAGVKYSDEVVDGVPRDIFSNRDLQKELHDPKANTAKELLTMLAVCHTVVPELVEDDLTGKEKIIYQAASPDEGALVDGAVKLNYVFKVRTPTSVVIDAMGVEEVYEILNVLEFNSTRKRMSVVVRAPNGQIKLYCKGADNVIYERLSENQKYSDITETHLEDFAREGLRTLCFGVVDIDEETYQDWSEKYYTASTALEDREKKVDAASELIERNMNLLGATAIEDKLQDGVPESIADLSSANIKIWVLTGDKQETAINIGYSCRLLHEELTLLVCEGETTKDVKKWLLEIRAKYNIKPFEAKKKRLGGYEKRTVSVAEMQDLAFVITGAGLIHAMKPECQSIFLDISLICRAVIACRVSPLQKSELVQMVKQNVEGAITLAIGDGANDVGMIQAAHVGVGISGQEGLQAASASDYAIGQFRYLNKLLLVHGAYSYQRLTKCILYSFYKNICLYVIELWFAIHSGFSGQVYFDKWCIGCYNVIFTMLPPFAIGLFDRTCSPEARLKCPRLYKNSQQADLFNSKVFWIWIATAIVHSLLLYYLPYVALNGDILFQNGHVVGMWFDGNIVYTCVVITVCVKAAMELDSWNVLSHIAIWGSIVVWFLFLLVYCRPFLARAVAPNMIGQDTMLFSCASFWFTLLCVPLITLLIDILYHTFQRQFHKNTRQTVQEIELSGRDPHTWQLDSSGIPYQDAAVSSTSFQRRKSDVSRSGYAFSQEERGHVSQAELCRRYDTNLKKPSGE